MITLAQAQTMIDTALALARAEKLKALAIIVLDTGAHPIAFAREDGASLYRFDIAKAKAAGALGMGADTRHVAERAKGNPLFYQGVAIIVGGQIAFSPGGVLVRDAAGVIVGAVGVSGDTGDMDEACAVAGILAAELCHGAAA